jgi:hypothetical protein
LAVSPSPLSLVVRKRIRRSLLRRLDPRVPKGAHDLCMSMTSREAMAWGGQAVIDGHDVVHPRGLQCRERVVLPMAVCSIEQFAPGKSPWRSAIAASTLLHVRCRTDPVTRAGQTAGLPPGCLRVAVPVWGRVAHRFRCIPLQTSPVWYRLNQGLGA